MSNDFLRDAISSISVRIAEPAIRKLPVKATTIQSSKGLTEDYVFITHFDDRYFIKDEDKTNISDQDICNFVVALTRARKQVFLISSHPRSNPTFLRWIDQNRIEDVTPPIGEGEMEPGQ
jgi:superfamily I DNA/RNA helicase